MKTLFTFIFLATSFFASSQYKKLSKNNAFKSNTVQPDYADLNCWAAHPWKQDPSDSLPEKLIGTAATDSLVDVFFIHPTTYTDIQKPFGWNAPIDNPELNANTDYRPILYQASVFNVAGRVFAPRYRQANLSCYYPQSISDTIAAIAAFDTAYADVERAFEYYLKYYNQGQPIIIASHSQGTTHGKKLTRKYFDGTALQSKLIAAYLVGMFIEPDYFKTISACRKPYQTGCICGWRTFQEGYKPDYIEHEKFVSIVTNPITWDADIPMASIDMNKGSMLKNFSKLGKGVVNANIEKGIIWTNKPKFFGNLFLTAKNFHIADYNFYYMNIRENVQTRIAAFWKR